MSAWTVRAIAELVGGTVLGDGDCTIVGVADIDRAEASHLTFLANPKYRDAAMQTRAGALLVKREVASELVRDDGPSLIACDNPYLALARVAEAIFPPPSYTPGVEPGAHVHPSAQVHPSATLRVGAIVEANAVVGPSSVIGAGCYVGPNAHVGAECLLHPGARVLHGCQLGNRVIVHAGAVIGSDGFGYAPDSQGRRHKIPQVGIVRVEDDVEIGANVTIDRATFGSTVIGSGTKIDNLVQIAHNVELGRDCVVVSQSGIAGSTKLGNRVLVGAQGGIAGHVTIADDVMLAARAGVPSSISQRGVYAGTPTIEHSLWRKASVLFGKLPELRTTLRRLEHRVRALESRDQEPS